MRITASSTPTPRSVGPSTTSPTRPTSTASSKSQATTRNPTTTATPRSGDSSTCENEDDFRTLYAYSPYHNVTPGTCYPPTLITTADHDDRVVPSHSLKFAAALQAAQGGDAPVLLRVETVAGHGAATPNRKKIEEDADRWAFVAKVMGL